MNIQLCSRDNSPNYITVWCNLVGFVFSMYMLADTRHVLKKGSQPLPLSSNDYLYAATSIYTDIFIFIRYVICWKGTLIKCFISSRRDRSNRNVDSNDERQAWLICEVQCQVNIHQLSPLGILGRFARKGKEISSHQRIKCIMQCSTSLDTCNKFQCIPRL